MNIKEIESLLCLDCLEMQWEPYRSIWKGTALHSCPLSLQPSIWLGDGNHKAVLLKEKLDKELGRKEQRWTRTCQHSALPLITSNQNDLQSEIAAALLLSSKSHMYFLLINSNLKPYGDSGKQSCSLAKVMQYKAITFYPLKTCTWAHLFKPCIISK